VGQRIPRAYAVKYAQYSVPAPILNFSRSDMHSESLQLTSGVIWTALIIDYPGHSFSHLGVFWGEYAKVTQLYLG